MLGSKKEIRHFTVHLRCVFLLLMGSSAMVFAERTPVAQTSSRREVVAEVGRSRGEARSNASSEEADEADKKKAAEKARKAALKAWRERLKRPVNGFVFEPDSLAVRPDSLSIVKFTQGVHFLDSLKGGQLDSVTAQISRIDYGTKVKYNYRDPFDPYMNQVFYRHGQGKFWFFGLGMLLLVVIMYFRAVFPKQFELRIRGVFNAYYFNELVNDFLDKYPSIVSNMAFVQGDMFDRNEYPDASELRHKFSVDLVQCEVPTGDFRCQIAQDLADDMSKHYERQANRLVQDIQIGRAHV